MTAPGLDISLEWLGFMVDSSLKATLLLVPTLVAIRFLRQSSAAMRHFVLLLVLLGVIALPLISEVILRWEVAPEIQITSRHQVTTDARPPPSPSTRAVTATSVNNPVNTTAPISTPIDWLKVLFGLWLTGALMVAARLLTGMVWAYRIHRTSLPISTDNSLLSSLGRDCSQRIGLARNIKLMRNVRVAIPVVSGWLNPAIVLPVQAEAWSTERLRVVLLHEMAHIKRYDVISGILAHVVAVVHWFNPLVWLGLRLLYLEREKACDDYVLAAGTRDLDYAWHLVQIGKALRGVRWLAPLEVALAHRPDLEGRLMDILNTNRNRCALTIGKMILIGLLALAVIVPLASIASQGDDGKVQLENVTEAEQAAIMSTLTEFYDALRVGEDYEYIRNTFLTDDYFDSDDLTLEKLDDHLWDEVLENTWTIIREHLAYGKLKVVPVVESIRRDGDIFVLTQTSDVISEGYAISAVRDEGDRIHIVSVRDSLTGEIVEQDHYLTNNLRHEVHLRFENGRFKVARYDDGLSIMQMDTENPYGPIYLIWVEDMGKAVTPYGPFISKVVPAEYMGQESTNIRFEPEE